jgi:hypothetical protein
VFSDQIYGWLRQPETPEVGGNIKCILHNLCGFPLLILGLLEPRQTRMLGVTGAAD